MATRFVMKVSALAIAAGLAATALADYTTGTVSGLTARQRRPWNGLVDISFTLTGLEEKYCIAVTATNSATGEAIPVRTLRDRSGNAIASRTTEFAPGAVSLVWDAMADAPGLLVEALVLSVVTARPHGRVQLWECGPYWAHTNIGAEEPWEYGLLFWWGDTMGYRLPGATSGFEFNESNTPTYKKSLATLQNEAWITTDGVLTPEHDAAHLQWGGEWRMPTNEELDALNNNCDWIWTTMNGVNGYVVRGRGDYSNASIFLPAAGYCVGTSLNRVGSRSYYWSSLPYSDNDNSWYLYFDSGNHDRRYTSGDRYYGQSIRPVQGFAE